MKSCLALFSLLSLELVSAFAPSSFSTTSPTKHSSPTFLKSEVAETREKSSTSYVDGDELLSKSTFPIPPSELIQLCQTVIAKKGGLEDESILADDFEFCAPVVGPLPKEDYLKALRTFKLEEAFDTNMVVYNMHVDPFEFNRVWYAHRTFANHTGSLFGKPPTGKELQMPPQMNSFVFNEEGRVKEMTVGYVLDRRVGNTGGLGAAFGFFYGVGQPLPIPECQPYQRSWQFRFLNAVQRFLQRFKSN